MFVRKVNYYETDKMGIVHHSNYIRWMEEARIEYMGEEFIPYEEFEDMEVFCPVLAVSCNYIKSYKFGDTVRINCKITKVRILKFTVEYTMYDEEGTVTNEGFTEHCFVNKDGRPVSLKKVFPEAYNKLVELGEE